MAIINVSSIGKTGGAETFHVEVREEGSSTEHKVTLRDTYYEKLTHGDVSRSELIRKSFAFLLEREPKESILGSFDLSVISEYFPEYEEKVPNDL